MWGMMHPSFCDPPVRDRLGRRAEALDALLGECTVCPHRCGVDRRVSLGKCVTGAEAVVASWTPHFGEEPSISGTRGSGTVFLANCNLRCVFCQNHRISQRPKGFLDGEMSDDGLAEVFLELQGLGCHNVNWVSPSHQVPQLVRALTRAVERGFSLPIVYNTNAYDSVDVLRLLDGVVDVYMPDLKYGDTENASRYSRIPDYPGAARAAIAEMFRQVGPERLFDDDGTLCRGLLIRLLVLPNGLADIEESLRWIAEELSPDVQVSLMAQYSPQHLAAAEPSRYPLLSRRISAGEWVRALETLEGTMRGDHHFVQDPIRSPGYYLPDFSCPEKPFQR